MRILSLSPAPFWDVEEGKGMPSIYLGQKGFVDAGHEVLFAVAGRVSRTYDYDGIHIHEFRLSIPIFSARHIWLHRLSLKVYWAVYLFWATVQGIRLARHFRPDVVYGHFLHAAPVAWLIGRLFGIPNVTRMYGTFLFPRIHRRWGRLLKFDEVLAFKVPCAYLIITNDGTRGDDCARILGVPKERVRFWRNGVNKAMYDPAFDAEAFKDSLSIPRHHKVLLTLCRLIGWKGVDRLIAALPKVLRRCPNTTAVIVGDGDDRYALEAMSRDLEIADNVRFVGLVAHEDVPRFLNGADIFASLYRYGNVGNPLLEAMCCGRCIVTLDNGASGRIITDGETGVLLDESRLDLLPAVLIGLLQDDARREALGGAAIEYARTNLHTWPERIQMEVALIERLAGAGKSQGSRPQDPVVTTGGVGRGKQGVRREQ